MPIRIACPGCGQQADVPDVAAGKTVYCPKCQSILLVPALEAWTGLQAGPVPASPPQRGRVRRPQRRSPTPLCGSATGPTRPGSSA